MGKRTLLLGVAGLITASALFAITILLFGHFGPTEGRILGTTALLAAFGVLALPATFLFELGRARKLALGLIAAGAATVAIAAVSIWWEGRPAAFDRLSATGAVLTLALTQTSSLVARRREGDPDAVRRLFPATVTTAAIVVATVSYMVWTDSGGPGFGRALGSIVILDLLMVALQPILAHARRDIPTHRLLLALANGEIVAVDVEAPDLATAAAKAIRSAEHDGKSVVTIVVGGHDAATAGEPSPQTVLNGSTSSSGV